MHQEDNETKVLIAQINGVAEAQRMSIINRDAEQDKEYNRLVLDEKAREFEENLRLNDKKLDLEKQKHEDAIRLKEKEIVQKSKTVHK